MKKSKKPKKIERNQIWTYKTWVKNPFQSRPNVFYIVDDVKDGWVKCRLVSVKDDLFAFDRDPSSEKEFREYFKLVQ